MIEIQLDGEVVQNKEQLHQYLAEKLDFPSWYGANLDALYDCLTDIYTDTRLIIVHSGKLLGALGSYGERLFQVLRQAQEDNLRFEFAWEE